MAIQGRHNLTTIVDAIRFNIGEEGSTRNESKIADATGTGYQWSLRKAVNSYLQHIRTNVNSRIRAEGVSIRHGELFLPFYRTSGSLTTSSGSATAYFPEDYDGLISLWDSTESRPLQVVDNPTKYHYQLRKKPPGPIEYVILQGNVLNGSTWQRQATLYPSPPTGTTPSIAIEYYRLPATMDVSDPDNAYPDIDPEFQDVLIVGVTAELMRADDPRYEDYRTKETELLLSMARGA